jgi:hypothetical protein
MMFISVRVHFDNICRGVLFHLSNRDNLVFRFRWSLNPVLGFVCHIDKFAHAFELAVSSENQSIKQFKVSIDVEENIARVRSGDLQSFMTLALTSP